MAEKAKAVKKLDTYVWEGTNKQGARVRGELQGTTLTLVKADLRRQGINPTKVAKNPNHCLVRAKRRSPPRTSPYSAGSFR